MKAKQIEDVLDALKSLRKKVKKSAQAQAKVEDKLAQVEAFVKALYQQTEPEGGKTSKKVAKRKGKQAKQVPRVMAEPTELTQATDDKR